MLEYVEDRLRRADATGVCASVSPEKVTFRLWPVLLVLEDDELELFEGDPFCGARFAEYFLRRVSLKRFVVDKRPGELGGLSGKEDKVRARWGRGGIGCTSSS